MPLAFFGTGPDIDSPDDISFNRALISFILVRICLITGFEEEEFRSSS